MIAWDDPILVTIAVGIAILVMLRIVLFFCEHEWQSAQARARKIHHEHLKWLASQATGITRDRFAVKLSRGCITIRVSEYVEDWSITRIHCALIDVIPNTIVLRVVRGALWRR